MDTFLTKLLFTYYQYKQKFNIVATINIFYCICVGVLLVFLQFSKLTIENILMILNFFIFINILLFIYKSNLDFKQLNVRKNLSTVDKDIWYYGFSSITIPLYMQMPLFIMTFFVEKEEIAIFYLAYTISSVMLLVSISINQQYLPKVIHNKNKPFFSIIKFPIVLLILFNILTYLFFYFFGHETIEIILNKPEYIKSNELILWLILSNCFQSISGLLALYLVSKNLMKEKLYLHLEMIIIGLILSIIFISNFSLYGVIITYLFIYSYSNLRYIFIIKKDKNVV
jgi:O-antigen/teichoic acid export membrane protein